MKKKQEIVMEASQIGPWLPLHLRGLKGLQGKKREGFSQSAPAPFGKKETRYLAAPRPTTLCEGVCMKVKTKRKIRQQKKKKE